jgi:DnaJ family protein C protein 17
MSKDDLSQYATSDHDFYALLGVQFESSESDIRRAYRKTALKYHPDKLGKDFDPEKFHLLQIANDVLSDPIAKAAYDNARNARLQKQKQHELFEGKRRQMKEDLEARERGVKRGRDEAEEAEAKLEMEMRRLAEDNKRRRKEMEEKLHAESSPAPTTPTTEVVPPVPEPEFEEEDEVARLERRIREAEAAKAKRKAEKKARKSGVFTPAAGTPDTKPTEGRPRSPLKQSSEAATSTPIKRPDIFKGLKADEKSSASPKFSFSPKTSTSGSNDLMAATMARLKAAEKARLEAEIRQQEAESS